MNRFYIQKQKDIVSGIPPSHTDPLEILRNKMEGREGSFAFREVSEDEVMKLIKTAKNSTSSGVDWIDNRSLKLVANGLSPAITRIINLSIKSAVFPSEYKVSKLVPIQKKDTNPLICNSWRPVNQLVSVGKLVERAMFLQVGQYLESNNLFHPNQHGGREGHSTTTALIQMYDQWVQDMEDGRTVAVLMIDQSGAFDVCDHPILEAKLQILLGLEDSSNPVCRWFHSYLSDRHQCTMVEGQTSPLLRIPACSVIQGGCGAGLLYSVLTCNLPDSIHTQHRRHQEPIEYCETDGDMTTFVDDSTNYYSHTDPLVVRNVTQRNYEAIREYMNSNKLKINGEMGKGDKGIST